MIKFEHLSRAAEQGTSIYQSLRPPVRPVTNSCSRLNNFVGMQLLLIELLHTHPEYCILCLVLEKFFSEIRRLRVLILSPLCPPGPETPLFTGLTVSVPSNPVKQVINNNSL